MVNVNETQIRAIGDVLNDDKRPLKERFRALFTLRNIGGPISIECINRAFGDDSALLKHELAYCLGQMQDDKAIDVLIKILEDETQEPMVRHEAAEAIGAIGSFTSKAILTKYLNDPAIEVAETCQLALERIKWLESGENSTKLSENPYKSIDPAPPLETTDVNELKRIIVDENASLFKRYRAMFTLRNMRTVDSVAALCMALSHGGALFKHEVAFVLGQLQDPASVPCLTRALENRTENEMVRHECAEALGAIATDDCLDVLNKYVRDEKRVVKESCEIALDMCEYENSPEFQYANALQVVT